MDDICSASSTEGEINHYTMEQRIEEEFGGKCKHYAVPRPDNDLRTPYEVLWHTDGNVILRAAEGTLFRLHHSILSIHSIVFRDMFSLGIQAPDAETFEGCPVVDMSDSVYDLTHFLLPLYAGGNSPHLDCASVLPFRVVSAMLRLGTKYEVAHLSRRALELFQKAYPSTLEAYDALPKGRSTSFHLRRGLNPIRTFLLARSFNLDIILPCVLYDCCQLRLSSLIHGYSAHGVQEMLSAEDLERTLACARELRSFGPVAFATIFPAKTHRCASPASALLLSPPGQGTPTKCEDVLRQVMDIRSRHGHLILHRDPLRLLPRLRDTGILTGWCNGCRVRLEIGLEPLRSACWKALPDLFENEPTNFTEALVSRLLEGLAR